MSTGKEQFEREFEAFLADEESGVAGAYRKLPQPEPDARLDAAVRAMAHRALNPQLVATPQRAQARRRRARWIPALGAAAGVVLAAGIAFKLGPSQSERSGPGAPRSEVISVRPIDPPPPAVEPPLSPAAPKPAGSAVVAQKPAARAAAPAPASAPASPPVADLSEDRLNYALGRKSERSAEGAAPAEADEDTLAKTAQAPSAPVDQAAAFPAEKQRQKRSTGATGRPTIAEGGLQDLHGRDFRGDRKAKTTMAPTPPSAAASAAAPPPATMAQSQSELAAQKDVASKPAGADKGDEPRRAPSAPPLRESVVSDAPHANATAGGAAETTTNSAPVPVAQSAAVPEAELKLQRAPASKDPNTRLYPEHWLANIRTMLREKHRDEALRSLAEFRRQYPDYQLPDDLRDLK
jgi:hypothetical protein